MPLVLNLARRRAPDQLNGARPARLQADSRLLDCSANSVLFSGVMVLGTTLRDLFQNITRRVVALLITVAAI
jgi:hypothetical protein